MTAWLKALGFVNCAEGFTATPAAINGFSDLILELWGDAGGGPGRVSDVPHARHATDGRRSAHPQPVLLPQLEHV